MKNQQPPPNHDINPVARRVSGALNGIFYLAQTALRPNKSLRLRWYDRVIRGLGVLILAAALIGMVYMALRNPGIR